MPLTFDDLIAGSVETRDGTFRVTELYLSKTDWSVLYLTLDVGGLLKSDTVIVGRDMAGRFDTDARVWKSDLDRAQIDAAPHIADPALTGAPALPPLVVGPFGTGYAPAAAELAAARARAEQSAPDDDPVLRHLSRFERAGSWIGLPVFGSDGEIGEITGLGFSDDAARLNSVTVGRPGLLGGTSAELPVARIRFIADEGTHLVVDATTALLGES